MNMLNERQAKLARLLVHEPSYKTIKQYAEILSMSYKTVFNDMQVIDEFFQGYDISIEKKPRCGIRLQLRDEQRDELQALLTSSQDQGDHYLSLQHRRDQIMLGYLWNEDFVSIQSLSNTYFVSTSSIVNDIEMIQKSLSRYALDLHKSSKGTKIQGSEINIRKALVDYVEVFLHTHMANPQRYQMLQDTFVNIHHIENINFMEIMLCLEDKMKDIEAVCKKTINEPYYTNAFLYLVIMVFRIKQGHCLVSKEELLHPEDELSKDEYEFTLQLVKTLENAFHIAISKIEMINIYRHLISGGLSKKEIEIVEKNTKENNLNSLTLAYTKRLIKYMSAMLGIDFTNQVYLHSNLRFHIKPMLSRLRYDIKINNMMLEEVKKRYPIEFYVTYISCMLTSQRYEIEMPPEEEVGYLMVYFQSAKERHLHHIKAIIVSQNSVGSTQLLKTRIENTFQDFHIQDVLNPTSLNNVNMDDVDVILSTGGISINLPYVNISPFCDEMDVVTIRQYIKTLKTQPLNDMKKIKVEIEEGRSNLPNKKWMRLTLTPYCEVYMMAQKTNHISRVSEGKYVQYGITYESIETLCQMFTSLLYQELVIAD